MGLEYEHIAYSPGSAETRAEDYLATNPNAKVPTLKDGETVLWESMAINLYLADKYGGGLKPRGSDGFALASQWSFWAMLEAEANLFAALFNRALAPEEQRDAKKAEVAEAALQKPLKVLNDALEGRDFLVGDSFSVADLNLAAIFSWGKIARVNLADYPNVKRWLDASLAREAYQGVFAKR